MNAPPHQGCLVVSSPDLLLSFRRLEFLQHLLEVALGLVAFGSIAAAALVRAPGHAGAIGGALVASAIALARALVVAGIRQRTGPHLVAVHGSRRWLVIGPGESDRGLGWSIDLRSAALPPGPLLLPGLVLVAATLFPALTRPWSPGTLLAAALVLLHQAAAAAVAHLPAHHRFRVALPWLLWTAAVATLVPFATGAHLGWSAGAWLGPVAWPVGAWLLIGGWLVGAALAAVRRDSLVLAGLGTLLALAALGARNPSPQLWTCFAIVSALAPPRRAGETQ